MLGAVSTAAAAARDIEGVEALFDHVEAHSVPFQLCHEPFYPPGDCGPARFVDSMRYNWIHGIDPRSDERLSQLYDSRRTGDRAVFESIVPDYSGMRLDGVPEDARCLPEYTGDGVARHFLRLGGFREDAPPAGARPAARYGFYFIFEDAARCEDFLTRMRSWLG